MNMSESKSEAPKYSENPEAYCAWLAARVAALEAQKASAPKVKAKKAGGK